MRLVFMGTPDLAVPSLEHLLRNGHEVAAVYTAPDNPSGRGRNIAEPPVKQAAVARGIPVFQPASLKSAETIAQLTSLNPEAVVVVAYGKLLPPAVLAIPPRGCVNVHPSLLPRHRGPSPISSAILAGDIFTGVSIMLLDPGMDTGPLLTQAQIPVMSRDTTGLLTEKLALVSSRVLADTLVYWQRGEIEPRPQENNLATYSHLIEKEDGKIDWSQPAINIWRLARACQPWPGAFTAWQNRRLEIIEAEPLDMPAAGEPGKVVPLPAGDKSGFGVATGKGILKVSRLQFEGKSAMNAADFLRGQRRLMDAVLG